MMIVELNDNKGDYLDGYYLGKFKVIFHHLKDDEGKYYATRCEIVRVPDCLGDFTHYKVAYSYCNRELDTFNKATGRRVALAKVLGKCRKNFSRQVWEKYFQVHSDLKK